MELKPINTKKQYDQWLQWIDEQFDKKIKPNNPEGEKLQVALILIKKYVDSHYDSHYTVPKPETIDVMELRSFKEE